MPYKDKAAAAKWQRLRYARLKVKLTPKQQAEADAKRRQQRLKFMRPFSLEKMPQSRSGEWSRQFMPPYKVKR